MCNLINLTSSSLKNEELFKLVKDMCTVFYTTCVHVSHNFCYSTVYMSLFIYIYRKFVHIKRITSSWIELNFLTCKRWQNLFYNSVLFTFNMKNSLKEIPVKRKIFDFFAEFNTNLSGEMSSPLILKNPELIVNNFCWILQSVIVLNQTTIFVHQNFIDRLFADLI